MTIKVPPILASLLLVVALLAGISTTAAAAPTPAGVLNDFEGGEPSGWFIYGGGASTTATPAVVVADSDANARPDQVGDNTILEATFSIGDYGGFGQDQALGFGGPTDWSETGGISFWFLGTGSGLGYQFEIADNRSDPASDTAERFDYAFADDSAGWRLIEIPWSDFTRATDFQPGGAPDDGLTLTEMWSWAVVLPNGADTVGFDDITLLEGDGGGGGPVDANIVEDFESGLPSGTDPDGVGVGYYTFAGAGSSATISTTAPTTPVPDSSADNDVMNIEFDVTSYAGFINAFTNGATNEWVSQDWSTKEGISFWINGSGSGSSLFLDILDNRNAGSTTDDAQRWTVEFTDDTSGWQQLQFPFSAFTEKGVGNNAPQDGFDRTEIHGFAVGALGTGGPITIELDNFALYGQAEAPALSVGFAARDFVTEEGAAATMVVKLNRALGADDPASVTVDYSFETLVARPGVDYDEVSAGSLTFTAGGPTEQTVSIQTIDDDKYEPTERIIARLAKVSGAELSVAQATVSIEDDDPYDARLLDDFEGSTVGWEADNGASLDFMEINAGDAMALPGQSGPEGVLNANVPLAADVSISGSICDTNHKPKPQVELVIFSTPALDAATLKPSTLRLAGAKELHSRQGKWIKKHTKDVNGDGLDDVIAHFKIKDMDAGTELDCTGQNIAFTGETNDGQLVVGGYSTASVSRDFPIGQDWSNEEAVSFWYKGSGTGEEVKFNLLDNRNPNLGPDNDNRWKLAWSDEFDGEAGTLPDPTKWDYEIGDGSFVGNPGWGNSELQYYTNDTRNVALNGKGQLRIYLRKAPDGLQCYYGPCEYTSARLVTTNKAEFAYGRVEARIRVPNGADGLWPAFWSLGTDIDRVGWPQTGEIDIMEYVSRIRNEVFGTIHGPGYAGGNAFGNTQTFDKVPGQMRTYAIEWKPDEIKWFVDGIHFHTATPEDVAPNEWVFNDPVYLLMNLAVGGNFGGPVSEDLKLPQQLRFDYVRVYQPKDTAERFEASFVDSAEGWTQVTIPFSDFVRSDEQPAKAPNDGLTLTDVWGYGFATPNGTSSGTLTVDQVRLVPQPAPTEITVTSTDAAGPGSINEAIQQVADDGTITFDSSLAGATINLSAPLMVNKKLTIDGSDAPGLSFDGGGVSRTLEVGVDGDLAINDVRLANGYGWQIGGCVIVNGKLTATRTSITDCTMATDAGDFWQGGGAVYVGENAELHLVQSTVSNSTSGWTGGAIFNFFGSTVSVVDSTISGNSSADVAGGIRSLGNFDLTNSTVSGNQAGVWQGGGVFHTDGLMRFVNSTVADNTAPDGGTQVVVATFTEASATVEATNSIFSGATGVSACAQILAGAGAVSFTSNGHNLASDDSCNPSGVGDLAYTDAGIEPLADNGGPTMTHNLAAGSAAVDAGGSAGCPSTDQRGVGRDDGQCDIGSVEYQEG